MQRSLVIPCYNEAASLPELVARCADLASDGSEVLLVDNGSSDETPAVLAELLPAQVGIRMVRVEVNRGYGHGILTGLRAARGELLGWTHADLQTDPLDARRGFALFDQVPDPSCLFVKGKRHGRPLADVAFTTGMALFETALMRLPLWDINAQPTLFHRRSFEAWRTPPEDFSLDLYAYCQAHWQGLAIRRFPVYFGQRAHGQSHWNVDWRAKLGFIRRTLDYSIKLRRSS